MCASWGFELCVCILPSTFAEKVKKSSNASWIVYKIVWNTFLIEISYIFYTSKWKFVYLCVCLFVWLWLWWLRKSNHVHKSANLDKDKTKTDSNVPEISVFRIIFVCYFILKVWFHVFSKFFGDIELVIKTIQSLSFSPISKFCPLFQ